MVPLSQLVLVVSHAGLTAPVQTNPEAALVLGVALASGELGLVPPGPVAMTM